MRGKAQVSMDFAIIASVALLLALFLFELYAARADSTRIFAARTGAQRVADDVARGINHAWAAGNGSVTHSLLPDNLPYGVAYNLTMRGRQVLVFYGEGGTGTGIASAPIATANVTAVNFTLVPGTGGRLLNITNANGMMGVAG